jgi:type II secretory pathway pseudopilin PulG
MSGRRPRGGAKPILPAEPEPRAAGTFVRSSRGFTLIEVLLASALMMFIIVLLGGIWQNAYRAADRTQSVLRAHQRARLLMDKLDDMLVQRSGTMPLVAQNDSAGKEFPWRVASWQARSLMDPTRLTDTSLWSDKVGGVSVQKAWTAQPPVGSVPTDAFAPDMQIRTRKVGEFSWLWGQIPTYLWHSSIMRIDVNRRYLNEDAAATPPDPDWRYDSWYSGDVRKGLDFPNYTTGWTDSAVGIATRFQANSPTSSSDSVIKGSQRNLTVVPWIHKDASGTIRKTPWVGQNFIYRSVTGPSFWGDLDQKGKRWIIRNGSYGTTSDGNGHFDPNWGFVAPGSWNPDAKDPAIGTPRPSYGDSVIDGQLTWRCEAPHAFSWSPLNEAVNSSNPGNIIRFGLVNSVYGGDPGDNWGWYHNLTQRNFLVVNQHLSAVRCAFYREHDGNDRIQDGIMSANVSRIDMRTGRLTGGGWTSVPRAARGRFGSLTLPGWYNGAGNNGDGNPDPLNKSQGALNMALGTSAGFAGVAPSSDEAPAHPAWVSAEVGVVDGYDRTYARPFELRFTTMWMLR